MSLENILNKANIEYHDPTHTYKVDGVNAPSVTTIAAEMQNVEGWGDKLKYNPEKGALMDAATLEGAADRGTRVHKVIEEHIKKARGESHELDSALSSLQSDGERKAYDTFLGLERHAGDIKYLNAELKLGVSNFNGTGKPLAGTTDIFVLEKDGTPAIWDIKAGQEVPETVGQQLSAYESMIRENTGYKGEIRRRVAHIPAKGEKVGDLNHTIQNFEKNEHIKASDLADYTAKFMDFHKNGTKVASRDEIISGLSSKIRENKDELLKGRELFGWINKDFAENDAKSLLDIYFEAADKAGVGVKTDVTSKGLKLGITERRNIKLKDKIVDSAFKKKDQGAGWFDTLVENYQEIRSVEIGEASRGAGELGEKATANILDAISHSRTIKAAAVGAVAGYAGGLAYSALHDNSDPTSMYKEDRHLLGNAIKGALVSGVAVGGIAAGMNMRNPGPATGEMVAHVGNKARGLGGRIGSAILNAWKACPNIK